MTSYSVHQPGPLLTLLRVCSELALNFLPEATVLFELTPDLRR
jgi:hypothetical protein